MWLWLYFLKSNGVLFERKTKQFLWLRYPGFYASKFKATLKDTFSTVQSIAVWMFGKNNTLIIKLSITIVRCFFQFLKDVQLALEINIWNLSYNVRM